MKVIESLVIGKLNKEELCEDAISITDNFIVVIDGVTSKSDFIFEGKKDGKLISEILVRAFENLNEEFNCKETINYLNSFVQNWYKEHNLYDTLKVDLLKRPAACVIIYSRHYNEIWLIGDCIGLYNEIIIENKSEIDNLATEIRIGMLKYLLETKYCTERDLLVEDISKEATRLLRKTQQFVKNKITDSKYNYTVIDGFDTIYDLVKVVKVPENTKEIILCSDGYPKIFPTLEETEKYLKHVIENDPLCYKINPYFRGITEGASSFDDRAYIRFEI